MSDIGEPTGLFRNTPFLMPRDEESISTCPLLTPSPTAELPHPLANPGMEYERRMSPCSLDTEASSCPPVGSTTDVEQDVVIPEIGEIDQQSLVEECNKRDSSSSSSCSVTQDTGASTQLLNSRNYLSLATDVNCQENGGIKTNLVGLALSKTTKEYGFTKWNWAVIRRWCFFGVMSLTVACVCVIIGYISTLPTRCDPPRAWHQGALIYQIFPPSFQDSNADGVGDIKGIHSRVDYIQSLGTRGVRLSYIFPSPHYPEHFSRVENLTRIDKVLGTFDEFKALIDELHLRNMSLILDIPLSPFFDELKVHDPLSEGHPKEPVKHMIINNHILVSPANKTSNWGTTRGLVTDILEFWLNLGVDGFYLVGLEKFIHDENFLNQIHEWRAEIRKFNDKFDKILICSGQVVYDLQELDVVDYEHKLNTVLKVIDLIEVELDPFGKGTKSIKEKLDSIQKGIMYSKPGYPWIYWTLGSIEGHRLASKAPYGNVSLAALLTSMMLPGSSGILYGDEIGLLDIHDPEGERSDLEHAMGLAPMPWPQVGHTGGFTHGSLLSWIPLAKTSLTTSAKTYVSQLAELKDTNPSIYMHGSWNNDKLIPNSAIRYADHSILTIERTYSRRHTYLLVTNLGREEISADLSSDYYGGTVVLNTGQNNIRSYITFSPLKLLSGQVIVVKLDK